MKRFLIILLGLFLWGFLIIPGGVLADPSHAEAHAQSPFDAPKAKKSPHCVLHGHQHAGHHQAKVPFCPHTMRDRNTQTQFKSDCGDSPSGTPVQIQWSKTLMLSPSIGKTVSAVKKHFLSPKRFRFPAPFPDRLEKPPQHA